MFFFRASNKRPTTFQHHGVSCCGWSTNQSFNTKSLKGQIIENDYSKCLLSSLVPVDFEFPLFSHGTECRSGCLGSSLEESQRSESTLVHSRLSQHVKAKENPISLGQLVVLQKRLVSYLVYKSTVPLGFLLNLPDKVFHVGHP